MIKKTNLSVPPPRNFLRGFYCIYFGDQWPRSGVINAVSLFISHALQVRVWSQSVVICDSLTGALGCWLTCNNVWLELQSVPMAIMYEKKKKLETKTCSCVALLNLQVLAYVKVKTRFLKMKQKITMCMCEINFIASLKLYKSICFL